MTTEEIIKFSAIALRQSRRQGNIAFGKIQQANQVVPFELIPGFIQTLQFVRLQAQSPRDQRLADYRCRAQHDTLFYGIKELPDITRP